MKYSIQYWPSSLKSELAGQSIYWFSGLFTAIPPLVTLVVFVWVVTPDGVSEIIFGLEDAGMNIWSPILFPVVEYFWIPV